MKTANIDNTAKKTEDKFSFISFLEVVKLYALNIFKPIKYITKLFLINNPIIHNKNKTIESKIAFVMPNIEFVYLIKNKVIKGIIQNKYMSELEY